MFISVFPHGQAAQPKTCHVCQQRLIVNNLVLWEEETGRELLMLDRSRLIANLAEGTAVIESMNSLNKPSATPPARLIASFAPRDDQSGMKKQFVCALISCQSSALFGPSNVDTKGFSL